MSWIKALVAVVTALVSVAATASASHALPVWDTSPVQVTRNVKPTPKVVDLRVGEHRNFDRVVIDLAGASADVPVLPEVFVPAALLPPVPHPTMAAINVVAVRMPRNFLVRFNCCAP